MPKFKLLLGNARGFLKDQFNKFGSISLWGFVVGFRIIAVYTFDLPKETATRKPGFKNSYSQE